MTTPIHLTPRLVVGVECHARVLAATKLFSGSSTSTSHTARPNTHVSLFDAAVPGTMPRLNSRAVEQAVVTGLAVGGAIARVSRFERKHYFYADLPLGYQITQQREPVVVGGAVAVSVPSKAAGTATATEAKGTKAKTKAVRIARIQLEQDTGKSTHDDVSMPGVTLVDLNRAGTALMEIVTEPDLESGREAAEFVATLQTLLRTVGTCDGNMQDGSLRADVNVSVTFPSGASSARVEVKNLNSLRAVERAVAFEYARLVEMGEPRPGEPKRPNETRGFDAKTGSTTPLRTKETMGEYRFMPEPDLPPLVISPHDVERLRRDMAALPDRVREKLTSVGLLPVEAEALVRNAALLSVFEQAWTAPLLPGVASRDARATYAWMGVASGFLRAARATTLESDEGRELVPPTALAMVVDAVTTNRVRAGQAKAEMEQAARDGVCLSDVVRRAPFAQASAASPSSNANAPTSSTKETSLDALAKEAVEANPAEAQRYRQGKTALVNFFVGKVVKATGGTADPASARAAVEKALRT